jgi:2,5-diketo-D-gluconate reductase A
MTTVPTVSLNTPTGTVPIPQLGFGVWQVSEDEVVPSVAKALEVGYQHIDTAAMYGNERGVGQAVQDSGLGDNVWVTTKLNNDAHGFDAAMKAFDVSMDKLQRDTLDLYLIHWPLPSKDRYAEAWKAMQAMRDDGRITTIGVCNFQIPHLQRLYRETGEYPAINQIELHPYLVQQELRDFHAENGIVTEAWSPLASGGLGLLNDLTVSTIAEAHDVTPAQVILRWHLQLGNVVIPKSVTPSRIEQNFDLFGFELTDDEVDRITSLDRSKRTGPHPDRFNPGS